MNNQEFVGARLELARSFHALTLKELAEEMAVSHGVLSHYENGLRKPSDDLVAALSAALKVRPPFFYEPLNDPWRESECSFRRRVMTPEKVKKQARAHGTFIGLVVQALASAVKFPKYNVPQIGAATHEEIESAAEQCRELWGLGMGPIKHIGRIAERNGVLLVRNFQHSEKIDAFSRRGSVSVIILNTARTSTSRWVFDVAHEIGHFVLHNGLETGSKEREDQADYFASALMLSRQVFSREFRAKPFSWTHIFDLKRRWYVSASAIIRRAFNLSLLDGLMYRRFYQQMSIRGWLKNEPHEPEFVGPELLASAFEILKKSGVSLLDFAARLSLSPDLFSDITGMSLNTPTQFKPRLVRA